MAEMAENDVGSLIESVDNLSGEIAGLRPEIQELHDYGRQNRLLIQQQSRIIRRQWFIIAAVVVLAIAFGALTFDARHTASVAQQAAAAAQQNAVNAEEVCRQANIARATTRSLWERIFTLPPIQALSPAEQAAKDAQVAIVRAQINTSYADQDCSKLGPQPAKK